MERRQGAVRFASTFRTFIQRPSLICSATCISTLSRICQVFPTLLCADKYGLPLLIAICTNVILDVISINNCLHMLDVAMQYASVAPSIMEKCLCLVDKSSKTVWESEQFSAIGEEALRIILQRDRLTADEDTICSSVDTDEPIPKLPSGRWAASMCTRRNMDISSANLRQVLGKMLFLIRFPLMTVAQLMDGPIKSGLLLQSEGWDIYRYKHATIKLQLPFPTEPRHQARAEGVVNYTVADARELSLKYMCSDWTTIGKLSWGIFVSKETDEELPVLGFYMQCSGYPKSVWTCQFNAELRLLPWKAETAPI
ncbi:BTB/POZ domain-containing protein 1-like [Paramacrobiotus metropolitanus]|uniref:BTB/POZ domain-containing protein 1-like n=1 Tax=Paramacrobiotus metropolitanus TaxID=2943436 RepID=UPI0024461AA7|nr:BTB/POZ domain-containing protein 1-like [Paramacrobiotus metropolitanus]